MKRSKKRIIKTIVFEILLIISSLLIFAPILLAIIMSIQPPEFVFSYPPKFLPRGFFVQNYIDAFKIVPFARMILNSALISIFITLGKLFTGSLSGYAYANFSFKGSKITFYVLFATLFILRKSC